MHIDVRIRVRRMWLVTLWVRTLMLIAPLLGVDRVQRWAWAGARRLVRVDVGRFGSIRLPARS